MKPSPSSLRAWACLLVAAIVLNGCGLLYTNVHVPRAYRSATPVDVTAKASDKIVTGEACNHSVLLLVAWGDASYAAAVKHALEEEPPGSILYDVQSDFKANVYMFVIYARGCTTVTGKVASP